jgi:hypothetical protein
MDDAKSFVVELEENAVVGIGAHHYLIGRRESIVSGFIQFVL